MVIVIIKLNAFPHGYFVAENHIWVLLVHIKEVQPG